MATKTNARLLAMLITLMGLCGTVFLWYKFISDGVYWQKASVFSPLVVCIGVSLVIYPITKEDNLERFGQASMPWRHIPMMQKLLFLIGILLGISQCAYFNGNLAI
jgi:hypothetical protein